MQSFLKKNWQIIAVYFFLTFLFILPQLSIHYPTLIDDGVDLLKAKNSSYAELFYDELTMGFRVWPLRLIWRKFLFDLFAINIANHFLAQSFLLFLTNMSTFYLLRKIGVNKIISFMAGLFIFILPATVTNYYRLGTAEHLQILILLISLILIKNKWLAFVLFSTNCLVKENSIFFLLVPLLYGLLNKKDKKYILTSLIIAIGNLFFIIYTLSDSIDSYIGQLKPSLTNILLAINTSPLIFIVLLFVIFYLIKNFNTTSNQNKKLIPVFSAFISSFFSLFIWPTNQLYYYLPVQILSVIVSSVLLNNILVKFKKDKLLLLTSCFFLGILIIKTTLISIKEGEALHKRHVAESALTKFIFEKDFSGYSVYLNAESFEQTGTVDVYLSEWKKNQKIRSFTPNIEELKNEYDKTHCYDIKIESISQKIENSFNNEKKSKKIIIRKEKKDDSIPICGDSLFIKEYCTYYISYK